MLTLASMIVTAQCLLWLNSRYQSLLSSSAPGMPCCGRQLPENEVQQLSTGVSNQRQETKQPTQCYRPSGMVNM